jgi:hypothetical protein
MRCGFGLLLFIAAAPALALGDAPDEALPGSREAVSEAPVSVPDLVPANPASPGRSLCRPDVPCMENGPFALWPSMRLRAGYEYIQPDPNVLFVGRNDGFLLDQARVGFETTYKRRFQARLVVELADLLPGGKLNDPVRPLVGAAQDAYLAWTPSEYFFASLGQQFMPFDYESQVTRALFNFTGRSVASGGLRAGRGFEVEGLSPQRQMGLVVGATRATVGPAWLDYRLALSNGNGRNMVGNDNKMPALFARFGGGLGEWLGVGLATQVNPRTTGELPNLFTETHYLGAADLRINAFGIDVLAQAIVRRIAFDSAFLDPTDPSAADHSVGMTAWIVLDEPFGLPSFGFKPGYRFSYYDPFFSDPDDQIMEHTFSIRYDPPTPLPLAFIIDATLLFENAELNTELRQSGRYLENNRVVALLQFDL